MSWSGLERNSTKPVNYCRKVTPSKFSNRDLLQVLTSLLEDIPFVNILTLKIAFLNLLFKV